MDLKIFQSTPAGSGLKAIASFLYFSLYLFCQEVFDELLLNLDKPDISVELSVGLLFISFLPTTGEGTKYSAIPETLC